MSRYEVLTLLTSLLAVVVAFVGLYRSSRTSARQGELQERQLRLEQESARLARIQAERLELGRGEPRIQTEIFQVVDLEDTAIKITIANPSSVARSINSCLVGLAGCSGDSLSQVDVEAEFKNESAQYPIALDPGASVILFSFGRRIKTLYERLCGRSVGQRDVLLTVYMADLEKPIIRTIGQYSSNGGLR